TIGSSRLNFRVRDGNGCDPADRITGKLFPISNLKFEIRDPRFQREILENRIVTDKAVAQARICCLSKFYSQAKGLISSGQLSTLLHLHIHPINLVVYEESHWQK